MFSLGASAEMMGVMYHNAARMAHGAGNVTWDDEIAAFAQQWFVTNLSFQKTASRLDGNVALLTPSFFGAIYEGAREIRNTDNVHV